MTSRPALSECSVSILHSEVAWGKSALLCLCIAREQNNEELAKKVISSMKGKLVDQLVTANDFVNSDEMSELEQAGEVVVKWFNQELSRDRIMRIVQLRAGIGVLAALMELTTEILDQIQEKICVKTSGGKAKACIRI